MVTTNKIGLATAIAVAAGTMSTFTAPAYSAEMTLTAASCFPIGSPPSRPFETTVKAINEAGKGIVKVVLKGGAPAIGSPFTLTQKTAKGAFDIVGCTEAYFGNILAEAAVFRLAEHPFSMLRQNGGLAYMSDLLAKKNLHYIGRHHNFGKFYLWLNKKIDKPDLTGLHLRVAPVYTAFFKKLGATVQTAALPQIYTLMENNTVQGYGWPALGWVPSWVKVTKYRVEPGFYTAPLHTLVNLKKWKSLPQNVKDVLTKTVLKFEASSEPSGPAFEALLKKQNDKTLKQGLSAIIFTGAEGDFWLKSANDAAWDEVIERSPDHGPKLRKLFTK